MRAWCAAVFVGVLVVCGARAAGQTERHAPAGPTSDAGFREPFGFQGAHIFAPLDWPDADRVRGLLDGLGLDLQVESGPAPALIATIRGPRGAVELR